MVFYVLLVTEGFNRDQKGHLTESIKRTKVSRKSNSASGRFKIGDSVENRKKRHDMERKYTTEIIEYKEND